MGGWKRRFVASNNKKTVIIQIEDRETTEPIISALCQPYDNYWFDFRWAIFRDRIEIENPIRSDAKCAESVMMAIEPE
jgi:hypothetical protein